MTQVTLTFEGEVAHVNFSSESGVNVFSSHVLGELGTAVERLSAASGVRFVVFRGSGRTFLAGADISEMSIFTEDQGESLSKHGHHVFDAIEALPQVTFAAVNGHALGGGCELAMACDFRISVASAKLGQPESRLGLMPGWGGTARLPRLVGMANARRLLFSGASIPAAEARQIGLVDDVAADLTELDATLRRWFDLVRPGSPAAIRRIKQVLNGHTETQQFSLCFSCSDAREGMAAFLEKSQPGWTK